MSFGAEARARLAALPVLLVLPWQCSLKLPRDDDRALAPSAATAKQEAATGRVSSAPKLAPPARSVTLPDAVVLKALDAGRITFQRCWTLAQRRDPLLGSAPGRTKVQLHLEIDERGKVTAARSDTESAPLARCLEVVARQLPFPAPGQHAVVDLPLIF